jgi:hypothetical protein
MYTPPQYLQKTHVFPKDFAVSEGGTPLEGGAPGEADTCYTRLRASPHPSQHTPCYSTPCTHAYMHTSPSRASPHRGWEGHTLR